MGSTTPKRYIHLCVFNITQFLLNLWLFHTMYPKPILFPVLPHLSSNLYYPLQRLIQIKTKQNLISLSGQQPASLSGCSLLCMYHSTSPSSQHLNHILIHQSGIGGCGVCHTVYPFAQSAQTAYPSEC